MVQKRPFEDEESYEISSKLPKQLKHCDSQALFSEINSSEDAPHVVETTGEDVLQKRNVEVEEKFVGDNTVEPMLRYEEDTDFSEDDTRVDEPFHIPFFPEYFFPERAVRTAPRHEDIYSLLLQHPPQKPVPLGPNHQAEIPAWNPNSAKNEYNDVSTSETLVDYGHTVQDEEDECSGATVIPMPVFESCESVGAGRNDCSCEDKSSIRCVRQHIVEAREELKRTIGQDAFSELGFLEMGETVADQWTEEEEHFFHHVVFSNPASMGRNFWNCLSSAFPSRTKREIISYYFNAFMLRRRAEQNRFDPSHADSDNDEWHISDEEDDDSVVESPLQHVGIDKTIEDDVNEYDEDGLDDTCDDNEDTAVEKAWGENGKNQQDDQERLYQDAQDDSCTSFDNGTAVAGPHLKDDNRDRWPAGLNGLNSGSNHEYVLEPCDTKLWDVGYMACRKREADFLPTCSMIEEVFGDESWNCKVDGKGS